MPNISKLIFLKSEDLLLFSALCVVNSMTIQWQLLRQNKQLEHVL